MHVSNDYYQRQKAVLILIIDNISIGEELFEKIHVKVIHLTRLKWWRKIVSNIKINKTIKYLKS